MKTEIIAVGTELLLGQIANTNARFISEELAKLGIDVFWHTVVGDNPSRVKQAFRLAQTRADLIIFSGGLGPTMDDLTKETVAEVLGLEMVKDEAWEAYLEELFAKMGRSMTDNNRKQALLPKGARLLENDHGTAPGIWLEDNGKIVVLLPGPPRELEPLFRDKVVPLLPQGNCVILSRVLKVAGLGESALEEKIHDLVVEQTNPTIAPLAKYSEVHLRLTAKAESTEEAQKLLDKTEGKLLTRLGEAVFGRDEETMAMAVARLLWKRNLTFAAAESCTGGYLSHIMTNIAGSSDYFLQGQVTYSNRAKTDLLGINPVLIRDYGAVSEEVGRAMAENIRRRSAADVAVGITGVAGPTGGSDQKPVGLVFIALATPQGVSCRRFNFFGNRETIKERAVMAALNMLRLYLLNLNG
ncbi:competence/damage-inducible protein A [Dethiobacter alkaliphilus]|uniref:Putative competence-damage inducible protein n=1 Tax=Dethiobacter alkaliphilus AHT 1 TaxID=555088 RepID=C0GDM5_DETAL|nr:competence/damage-inducible protein A [Dethiobacter alkaliphilus]EEG78508.1 competence/damage-inducible protein CinA [Dethiobacter alkaliphilus AHT 1]